MNDETICELVVGTCFGTNGIIEIIRGDIIVGLILFYAITWVWLERHFRKSAARG